MSEKSVKEIVYQAIVDLTKAIEVNNLYVTDPKKNLYAGKISREALDALRAQVKEHVRIENLTTERAEAYFIRGISTSRSGDMKCAIEDITTAVELDPTNSNAYFSRAMIKSENGDQQGAVLDFSSSIKLRPNFPEAFYFYN